MSVNDRLLRIANQVEALEKDAFRERHPWERKQLRQRTQRGKPTYKDYVQRKKDEGEKPLSKEMWESRQQGGRALTQPNYMDDDGDEFVEEEYMRAAGKIPGVPDGTGPNPNCPRKKEDEEELMELDGIEDDGPGTTRLLRITNRVAAIERQAASKPSYKDYVKDKKKKGEKPLSKDEWESKVLGKGKKDKGKGKGPTEKLDKALKGRNPEITKKGDQTVIKYDLKLTPKAKKLLQEAKEIGFDEIDDRLGRSSSSSWEPVAETLKAFDSGRGQIEFGESGDVTVRGYDSGANVSEDPDSLVKMEEDYAEFFLKETLDDYKKAKSSFL